MFLTNIRLITAHFTESMHDEQIQTAKTTNPKHLSTRAHILHVMDTLKAKSKNRQNSFGCGKKVSFIE